MLNIITLNVIIQVVVMLNVISPSVAASRQKLTGESADVV